MRMLARKSSTKMKKKRMRTKRRRTRCVDGDCKKTGKDVSD